MAVKLADTLAPMGDFEIAEAKDVSVMIGETKKRLQQAIEDGDIGGAGEIVVKCTEAQYGALLPAQKALNIIYCTEKFLYYHDESIAPVVDVKAITDTIGDLEELKTEEKGSVVGAINEVTDSLVDKVPFKFGITEDGQYGYIKAGADTVTPFKSGEAEFIGGNAFKSKITLPTKGEYIVSVTSYSSSGVSTARSYTQLKTVSDGTFEQLTDTASNDYSVRAYKITTNSDNVVCTFGAETNTTVTKIG